MEPPEQFEHYKVAPRQGREKPALVLDGRLILLVARRVHIAKRGLLAPLPGRIVCGGRFQGFRLAPPLATI